MTRLPRDHAAPEPRLPADDAELHAHVDGELDPAALRRIERRLEDDAEARSRVADYEAITDDIRALYGPVAREPVPQRLLAAASRRRAPRVLAAAAALLIAVASGWLGWQLHDGDGAALTQPPHIVAEAAMAYRVYAPEVRHPVEVGADEEPHLVAWLGKRLGAPVVAPRLADLGFELLGGRLLATEDGPGALLLYQDGAGRRLALYMCENEQPGSSTSLRFARDGGLPVVYWLDGPFSYAVAAELDRDSLARLAESIYRQVVI
jgi:anti-sigma factor RsiW